MAFSNRIRWLGRTLGLGVLGLQLTFATSGAGQAQTFPNRPVTIVVPAAAGGALDTISRLLAHKAATYLKQPVIVENRPGANWMIGMEHVAKAAPDGYTLLFLASSGVTVNPFVFPNMPIDPLRDLTPVTIATHTAFVLLMNPKVPARNLQEFIAHLRANPGKLNHGSNSSTTMLMSELFKEQAKVEYLDVNYRGAAQSIVAAIAGTVDFCFVDLGSGSGPIRAKTLIPMGVTSSERSKLSPDLPTIAEQGLPGYSADSMTLLMVPANVPAGIMKTLNSAFRQALEAPDVRSKLMGMNQVVVGGSPEEAVQALQPEAAQWKKLIQARNIQFGK